MPTLFNPAGVSEMGMNMECSAFNVSSSGTSTTYRTPMTADALLDHYGKQLSDSGWTVVGERVSISGRSWTPADSAGNPIETSITVKTGRESGCRELNMQAPTRLKRRRPVGARRVCVCVCACDNSCACRRPRHRAAPPAAAPRAWCLRLGLCVVSPLAAARRRADFTPRRRARIRGANAL